MKLKLDHAPTLATALALWAVVAPSASSQELPEGVRQVASVEGITEYRLDNGLRFLLFPDQSKQQITVHVTYMVGSRHEGYGETGMAHLLEHLLFKGTPDHPNIPDELTERGAFTNGTTGFDRTDYYETFPASDDNLAWAIDLEADRMVNSFIAAEDLESEMTVVRNELDLADDEPLSVLRKRVMAAAYNWHNYGNSTLGVRADVENLPIERLQAFYRRYYQPDNALVVIGGHFEPEYAIELVAEEFGAIPRPERTGENRLFETYTAEPVQDGERTVTLRRVGDVQMVMAAYHVPPGSHEQTAAVQVLTHILGTRPAGRLYRNLVEPGLAANAFTFAYQLKQPGVLLAVAEVRQEDSLEEAAAALIAAVDEMVAAPPAEEEVARARTDYLSGIELAMNNPQGIALQLSEWAAIGDWRLFFLHRDRLEQVTPTTVHQVAQAYLKPSNRTIGYYQPTQETPARAEIPAAPDVAALVAGYSGREAVAEGEAFDPTPANVEARTTTTTLSSGVQVALLPKENRGDAVSVHFEFRHGTEATLTGRAMAGSLAGGMLMRGTTRRSRQEIGDELNRLKAEGGVDGNVLSASGFFTTVRENLAAVLGLAGEILREPAFDPDEFEVLRQERLAAIEPQLSEPEGLVLQAFNRHVIRFSEAHPRYLTTYEEEIERLNAATVDDARTFWSRFYGAQGGAISVVGDFDPDETLAVLEEVFADWTAPEPYEHVPDPYVEIETVSVDIETPDKANAWMAAVTTFPMRDDDPRYPALRMADFILGGGFLNSRLTNRIRQEEGLSYGVGSLTTVPSRDNRGVFLGYAIFAPENAEKVVEAFRDEMRRALEDGFTQEELDAARRGYLDTQQNGRSNDLGLASQLSNNLFLNRGMPFIEAQEAAFEALTLEEVNRALRDYLPLDRISVFRGGDFANKLIP